MARKAAVLAICLMFLPMLAFAQDSEVKKEDGGQIYEAVFSTFKGYITAFQAKDIDRVMSVFSDDPNTVMMGTGPEEIWVGKNDIRMAHKAFLADFEKVSTERTLVSVNANGEVAWLTGYIVETQHYANTTETFQVNLSVVLEKDEGTWYITLMHFSNLTGSK